jgi:hypothetical protein
MQLDEWMMIDVVISIEHIHQILYEPNKNQNKFYFRTEKVHIKLGLRALKGPTKE